MRRSSAFLLLLLAGCGGAGGYSKPGADESAASRAYRECRELTDTVVKTQADIDQDIRATRGADAQRMQFVRTESDRSREQTRDRAAVMMSRCMEAQGFSKAR